MTDVDYSLPNLEGEFRSVSYISYAYYKKLCKGRFRRSRSDPLSEQTLGLGTRKQFLDKMDAYGAFDLTQPIVRLGSTFVVNGQRFFDPADLFSLAISAVESWNTIAPTVYG